MVLWLRGELGMLLAQLDLAPQLRASAMITASLASSAGSMLAGQSTRKFSLLWLLYKIVVAGTMSVLGLVVTAYYSADGTRCLPKTVVDLRTGTMTDDCYNAVLGWGRYYAEASCAFYTSDDLAPSFRNVQPFPNRPLVLQTLLWVTGAMTVYELLMLVVAVMSVQAVRDSVGIGWSSVQDLLSAADRAGSVASNAEAEAAIKRVVKRAAQLKLLMSTLPHSFTLRTKKPQRYRFVMDSSLQSAPWWLNRLLLVPYHSQLVRIVMFLLFVIFPPIALVIVWARIDPLYLLVNEQFQCSFRADMSDQTLLYPHGVNHTIVSCDFLYSCTLRLFASSWIAYSVFVMFAFGVIIRTVHFAFMWWGPGMVSAIRKRPSDSMLTLNYDFPVWRQYFDAFDDESEVLRSIVHAVGLIQALNTTDVNARNRASQAAVSALQLRAEVERLLTQEGAGKLRDPAAYSAKQFKRHAVMKSNTSVVYSMNGVQIVDEDPIDDQVGGPMPAFESAFAAGQVRMKALLWIILRMWHSASLPTNLVPEDTAAGVTTALRENFDKYAEILDHWPCVLWGDTPTDSLARLKLDGLLSGWRVVLRHYQRMMESHELETLLADVWLQYLTVQKQIDYIDALRWLSKRVDLAMALDALKLRKTMAERFGRQFDQAAVMSSSDVRSLVRLTGANPDLPFVATPIIRKVSRWLFVQLYTENGVSQPLVVAGHGTDCDDLILLKASMVSSQPLLPDIRSHLCTMVDLESMMSGRGWDGVRGTIGLHLAWPRYVAIAFGAKPEPGVFARMLTKAVALRGYNGFAVLAALCASRDLHTEQETGELRGVTWRVLLDLLLSDPDSCEASPSESWLLEIIKQLLSILFSRRDLTAVDRWHLSSKFLKSGFNAEFRTALVKLYVEKASNLTFVVSDENLLHLILSLHNTQLEPLIREALMAGAAVRVNHTTFYGTLALVEACSLYLSQTQSVDDLKEVINALLDAGADINATDARGQTALLLAIGDPIIVDVSSSIDHKSGPPPLSAGKRRGSRAGMPAAYNLHDKRNRLKLLLTHHRRQTEVSASIVDSTSTLRGWREEVLHHLLDGAGNGHVNIDLADDL